MTRPAALTQETVAGSPPVLPPLSVPRNALFGFCWAGLSVLIFAGWFVVTRFSVTRELRVWDVAALRFGVGALILLPVLLRSAKRLSAKQWLEGLMYSCLWGVPFVLAVGYGACS